MAALPDGAGGNVSFSQAREIILSHNAGLKSARTETEAASAGVSLAGVMPNPGVGIALDKFGANEIEVTIEQAIELGGKRQLRAEVAQKDVDMAKNTYARRQLELEAEIVRRFIPIYVVSMKLSLIDSIIDLTEATREQIQLRVDAGAAKRTDLIRTEIDIEQRGLERSELLRESEQARKKFAALGGESASVLLNVFGTVAEGVEIPSLDALYAALENNPELKAVTIEEDRLATLQKQLHAEVVPDLNLSAGYLRSNAESYNSPLVGVSMNIPLFNKNTAAQEQIELQRQAVGERRKGMLSLLGADIQSLHSRLLEIDKKITTLRTNTIPKTEQVYSLMQEYYSAGSAGFLDLTATQAEMLNVRMALLDLQTERAEKLAELMQATSLNIPLVH